MDHADSPVKVVLLDLEMSNQLDVPSLDMLKELKEGLEQRNTGLWMARLHRPVRDALVQSELIQEIDPENIYARAMEGILEYLSSTTPDTAKEMALVQDGLKNILAVIDRLLSNPTEERRDILEQYRQKLEEVLNKTVQ